MAASDDFDTPSRDAADRDAETNVSSFLQRMYDPSITRGLESRMSPDHADLIHVPWKLQLSIEEDDKKEAATDDAPAAAPPIYPSFNYLELRRKQNKDWATDRLKEGIRLAKEGKSAKAEESYKEGIDLVPTHAALFVAYGALCANLGRTQEAVDKLQHALELDPKVPNAQNYLDAIQKQKAPPRQAGSVNRSETALQDALMERSFLKESKSTAQNQNEKYPLVHEEKVTNDGKDDAPSSKRKHRRKKNKKRSSSRSRHRKSRSKRKRRKYRDCSSDEDDSFSDESSSRQRRRRRHRRRDSSSEEPGHRQSHDRPSTDETSEETNRRRRRKRHSHSRQNYSSYSTDISSDREHRKARRRESKQSRKHKRSRRRSESRSSDSDGKADESRRNR